MLRWRGDERAQARHPFEQVVDLVKRLACCLVHFGSSPSCDDVADSIDGVRQDREDEMICPHCMSDGLDDEATRCPHCGGRIGANPMRKWVVSIVLLVAIVAVLVMFTTSQNKASRQACDQVEVVC